MARFFHAESWLPVVLGLVSAAPALASEKTILDVYAAIGDTEYFPLVKTLDGHTITNSFGDRLDTVIDPEGRFLAYLEEGGGWAVNTYKFWPLADGGTLAATVSASFEREVMYPDTFVEFFAHGPGDPWGVIKAPLPFVDASDFLERSPEPVTAEAQAMRAATQWEVYHALSADSDDLVLRLTATNRDKCWPETVFGFAIGNPPEEGLDFCRDVYANLTTELRFELDREAGRFAYVGD